MPSGNRHPLAASDTYRGAGSDSREYVSLSVLRVDVRGNCECAVAV